MIGIRLGTIDQTRFERWGARGCGNSHYSLVRTSCCGACLVEDAELGDLYWDPDDSGAVLGVTEIGNCPVCGAQQWDYADMDAAEVRHSSWVWALDESSELGASP